MLSLQMETENVPDQSNISVSIGLQNVMDHYRTDKKVIRYSENIVLVQCHSCHTQFLLNFLVIFH